MLEDPHPQICPPENIALTLESTPQSSQSASLTSVEMDSLARMFDQMMSRMDARLAETKKEAKADMKLMGNGLSCHMREGLAEVKADMKAMGEDVALKFQAVWDEVYDVRGCCP